MAKGFFKHIPNIAYDFKSDGNFYQAKDLFRKVSTFSYLQQNITGYEYYRVVDGERPDVVASKLYGDSTLYWTFYLVNENLQDTNDWPKSNSLLKKFIDRKYSGTTLTASSSTDIVSYNHDTNVSSKFLLGEKVSVPNGAFGFITKVDPTFNRIIINSRSGSIESGVVVTGEKSSKSFTISSVAAEKDTVKHYLDSNNLRTLSSSGNTPVSFEEHERSENEDKTLIRYIQPKYINQVVKEFIELVRD
mgnify:FL=1|tara:strand:- start:2348 stop:3088 length:741 start_codon:yes stop_codon:yes gene_type:complete